MFRNVAAVIWVVLAVCGSVMADELDLLPLGNPDLALDRSSAPAGSFYDSVAGTPVEIDALAARLVQARVVLLGESHTDMAQKKFHGALFEAMAELKPGLVLGMEFFLRSDNEVLREWTAGDIDEDELLRKTGWYERGTYNFGYYRPVMTVARDRGIRVVGLNVDRKIPRAVNRGGLDALTDEQRAEVGEVVVDGSPQHRYLIGRYFGETVALLPPGWFDNMYSAQCLWDVVMARSILADLRRDETMVVIVGSGHVAYGLGIPRRLHDEVAAAKGNEISVATFCPVTAPPPDTDGEPDGHPMGGHGHGMGPPADKPGQFVRSIADYVGVFSDTGGVVPYPTVGLKLKDEDGVAVVSMAWPDTPAAEVGFATGDRILDLNGAKPADLPELREMLANIRWGQRLGFMVEREETEREIAVLMFPTVDLTEGEIAPGWTVDTVTDFDPRGSAPVTTSDPEAMTTTVLVSGDDGSRRVEIHTGDVLEEIHDVGDSGLVTRSLLRTPLDDGTVEIRYVRDDDGAIVASQRLDRTGQLIDD